MDEGTSDLRARLLRAAGELLESGGVEAVTIREIARRAGVSHGAPRRHFASRALLLATLARDGFDELGRRFDALPAGDATARLVGMGQAYVALARERPALLDLMVRHDLLESSGLHLRTSSLALAARWQDAVRAARPGTGPEDAVLLLAAVHGLAALHAHRALDVLGADAAALVARLLDPPPSAGDGGGQSRSRSVSTS